MSEIHWILRDSEWTQADIVRLDGERLLRSVPNPPDPPDEAWRRLDFIAHEVDR